MTDHGANRIELECQVLCAALRASWAGEDAAGRAKACLQLSQLFPDLVTPYDAATSENPRNNYQLLELDCDVSPTRVVVAYFRLARKFLRENNPRQKRVDYFHLLDAGFMLRKPRLRLSHDLVVSRSNLVALNVIHANGTFDMVVTAAAQAAPAVPVAEQTAEAQAAPAMQQGMVSQPPQAAQVAHGGAPTVPGPPAIPAQPAVQARLPAVIELLKAARLIGPSEVQALTNQMRSFPGVSAVDLVLSAGYVTESEMKSVQLGEFLLGQGKINLGQFCVAIYDERSTGVKMAESLHARGWLKPD